MTAHEIDPVTGFDPYDDDPTPLAPVDAEHADAMRQIAFNEAVANEARRIEIRRAAQLRIDRAERATLERPHLIGLQDLLDMHFDQPAYRIQNLWPSGGRVLCAAGWKAGKSTMVGNVIRALVDGDPFLGEYLPTQARHVLLIDNELDPARLQQWFRDQHITNTNRVTLLSLRGRTAAFDILDPDARTEWVKTILDTCQPDVVILDCLRPILDAFGLDENHEAGRFLVPFDALLAELDATEGAIIHHMGHTAERSRGDSRLLDWPDALWKIVRDKDEDDDTGMDDPQGSRYFSAYGRDVDQSQVEMVYDPPTRRLTLGTKTRTQAGEHRKLMQADQAVIAAITAQPGITKRSLRAAAKLHGATHNPHIDEAVERLVETGIIIRTVKGQTHMHTLSDRTEQLGQTNTVPNRAQTVPSTGVPSALKGLGTPVHTTTNNLGTGTVPCPHCDLNKIPPGADMCDECHDRLIRESEPDD